VENEASNILSEVSIEVCREYWNEKHQKEVKFQRSKERKMNIESFKHGTLLVAEIDPDLLAELQAQRAKDKQNAPARERDQTHGQTHQLQATRAQGHERLERVCGG